MAGFDEVVRSTPCPFAASAHIAWCSGWDHAAGDPANHDRLARELHAFVQRAQGDGEHGFVAAIGGRGHDLTDIDDVERLFVTTLVELDRRDRDRAEKGRGVRSPRWQWRFDGMPIFLNVFAACYPPRHPKHLGRTDEIVLFLQPVYSFALCNADSENRRVKLGVRRRFDDAGRPYDGDLVDRGIDADLYLSPLELGAAPRGWPEVYARPSPP